MTRRWLRAVPVLWISALALLVASVPAGAATLTWRVVPSPNPGSTFNVLTAVSCVSPGACTAVGKYNNPGVELTLIESWNGTKWTVTNSPSPGTRDLLSGVSCASAATCTAAGSNALNPQTPQATLIETGR